MVTVLLTNHEDVSVLVVQRIIPFTFFNPQSFFSFFGQTATLNHALKFPKYSIFSRELPEVSEFSNTSPNVGISQDGHLCFASPYSLVLTDLTADVTG